MHSDIFLRLAETVTPNQGVPARRLVEFKLQNRREGNPRFWAIVDFNQHSANKRLYVFDTQEEEVTQYYVAHGKGSDPDHNGIADIFSNVDDSHCSSLGIYRCSEPYEGEHELSLRLDGLESTNSQARDRTIVLHTAWYVSDDFIRENKKLGRSWGCFVVQEPVRNTLIDQLKDGSFLIAWKSEN